MLDIAVQDNTTILLSGTIEEGDLIKKTYEVSLDSNDGDRLIIHCKKLATINGLFIAWLIACWRYCSNKNIRLTLQNIPQELQQLIHLYRLDQILRSQ